MSAEIPLHLRAGPSAGRKGRAGGVGRSGWQGTHVANPYEFWPAMVTMYRNMGKLRRIQGPASSYRAGISIAFKWLCKEGSLLGR